MPNPHRFAAAFEQSPIALVVYDAAMQVTECNEAAARLLGVPRDAIVGLDMDDLRDQRHRAALECALAGRTVTYESLYHATTTDAWLWVSATFAPLRDTSGAIESVLVCITDSTAKIEAEHATRTHDVSVAQRLGRVGSWRCDIERDRAEASPEFFRILGVARESLARPEDFERFVHADDQTMLRAQIGRVFTARQAFSACEFRITRPDGVARWVVMRAEVKYAPDGRPAAVWGTMQDVTERRTLEEQLRRAQRMEGLGQLAGGVAHDFNNLLTIIQVEADFLYRGLASTDPLHAEVQEIRRAAERAGGLTRQLLAFSRKQVLRPRLLDMNELVNDTISMLRRLIGEDIELATVLAPGLPPIAADPGQLQQVLVNLAVNARDAMPHGGVLRLETAVERIGADDARVAPGEYIALTVSDTGTGMDDQVRQHIFDPFFTTKPAGHGTGLGLSTVLGIVEQSRGAIAVRSKAGGGSRFTIHLPCADASTLVLENPVAASGRPVPPANVRGATVLLVEDERSLRDVSQRVLEREGFSVLSAEDGFEGLAIAETFSGTIDLLITDLVLPGLNGRDLASRLVARRPCLQVLYMSGYTDDDIARRGLLDAHARILEKPFSGEQLAASSRDAVAWAAIGTADHG